MKLSSMVGDRFRETPADCQIISQIYMIRGGYIKQVANGIYSLYTPARRIVRKIENIIREEMDAVDGQEVLFPVVMPADLWRESGRYDSIGSELARFKDRGGNDMVLGMTHEEASVQLVRGTPKPESAFPFMIYQIQTKFRDEPRARGGLIRVREFTMKDAYSFHTSQADLEEYYARCYHAYERIFARCGVPEVVAVKSDSGMMGGNISHEFMLLTDIGEDTIVTCPACGYRSNMEAADCVVKNEKVGSAPLTKVATPGQKTIEEVCNFLSSVPERSVKAVVYQENLTDKYIVVFLRGDLEVNETKLRNFVGCEIHPAEVEEGHGIVKGFIGPVNFAGDARVLFDKSLDGTDNMICGANEVDCHYTGLNIERDLKIESFCDVAKTYAGAICPVCGKPEIQISRGVEVGNIFQLGTKYSHSMGLQYQTKDGGFADVIMGCYGIGIGRLCASVCEVRHDDYGPIWPITIAPWQVHLCAMRADKPEVKEAADKLYDTLQQAGIEVIYDDRPVSAGVMFSDADLLGVPVRVIVSPKTLGRGAIELAARDKSFRRDVPVESACEEISATVREMLAAVNNVE
ncbi:MAG: proline--tRNA ligase [Clostridia bacterium]|nr:proline--tRNA ligase [Clostridia bacterium]